MSNTNTYHFPSLWNGKNHDAVVVERHDIVLLFDAKNCNPNGDPDTGNMPRLQPDTLTGLVTDVCLKRKIRNFFARYNTNKSLIAEGEKNADPRYNLFIREDAVIERVLKADDIKKKAKEIFLTYTVNGKQLTENDWETVHEKTKESTDADTTDSATDNAPEGLPSSVSDKPAKKNKGAKGQRKNKDVPPPFLSEYKDRAYHDAICELYFDVRYFGQVVSTEGPLKGSFYGQIRGPIQFSFAESYDKILQLDFSITRCAVASETEAVKAEQNKTGNRTMGRKYNVAYGLYRSHIHFSPAFAAKTRFTYADLDNFLFALSRSFGDYNVDTAAARADGLRVVGLVDFEHQSSLGNAPVHKLFELVTVQANKDIEGKFPSGGDFPSGLDDYRGSAPDGEIYAVTNEYGFVTGCSTKKPENPDSTANIHARRLIWELGEPPQKTDATSKINSES
ncbi:MAG: type I-C CRISPR-associated protein Cas7/Csd2 [Puniceicoccales bacterium]|jgi:CRISPR-associated protein Csd2|nr:type I-C CRISPR-associated protein Cas7/Csd2 [Puniceicoccales bacterium]